MSSDSKSISAQAGKVAKFPIIYEDELLYSVVARYGFMSGYVNAAASNFDLFGRAFGHASTRMPANLDALAKRLPDSLDLSGRDLVLRHTLFPYPCAFLPKRAFERVISNLLAEGGRKGRPMGGVEKPLPRPATLRFCPECLVQMENAGQELHWKRVHQLAIVTICPEHECDLRESDVAPRPTDRRLHPAGTALRVGKHPSVIPAGKNVDRTALLALARDARLLLRGRYPVGMARESGPAYAEVFRNLGYDRGSRLDWAKLEPAIEAAIADITPALPGIAEAGNPERGWLSGMMIPGRPGHTDRVLIAALILRRIEAIQPRFWAVIDKLTGRPLLSIDQAA